MAGNRDIPLKNLLYVDDDSDIRDLVCFTLSHQGRFNVDAFESGTKALSTCEKLHPQMVVLDVLMPDISGPELLQQLKQFPQYQDIPFVFLTANSSIESIREYKAMGVCGVICKPIMPHTLPEAIESIWSEFCKKNSDFTNKEIDQLHRNYLDTLQKTMDNIQELLGVMDSRELTGEEINQLQITAHNLKGSGKSFGFPDLSDSARILSHTLDDIIAANGSQPVSDHQQTRIIALLLALITMLEKAMEGPAFSSDQTGAFNFVTAPREP